MRKLLLSTTFLISGLIAGAARADDQEIVVVTATRIPTPQSQIASSITVVTADQIAARQEQTLPDVLKDVPGLNVVQTGGPGGQTSVFLRGANSNHVKVLIDGIDVSDPSSTVGAFDFGQVLTPDIQRVEVLRGPQSGVYGSDAIGGVINIITKSGSGPAQFTAAVEGGSFDTFNQSAGVSGSTGGFHYAANVEHFYSGATPVTPLDLLLPGEVRHDDKYDNLTASTKLGYDVTGDFDLGLVARYTNSQLHLTGTDFNLFPSPPDATQSEGNTLQYYTRGTAHLVSFGGVLDETLGLAYSSTRSNDYSPDGPPSPSSGSRVKLDWQGNVRLSGDETLVLGAEHERDEVDVPVAANTSINSLYAEIQSNFGGGFYNAANIRYDDNDRFGSKVTYRIAPTYTIAATGTQLKASLGTGFKAPTLEEMFENFPPFGFFGNPNLKPETSTGYDAGFEQPLFGDTAQFGATYFRNNIRNLIDDNATFTSYANVGRAETDGVESFIAYQPLDTLTLRADYTYTEANDEITHQELLRRPKHKVNFDANWQATGALSFNANVLYVSSWTDGNRDFSIPRLRAPSYTTTNVAANYDITGSLAVFGRIDNLFDAHYQNPVGFLQPSRGFFAGIKAKI
ncbi:MAG TPA: TonB-dependent receptor [Rhizomicrobium sp.]|jgi:vitamin B12 transporter|nr:TonB-dependent receptor [Rhizomicrobium sp.]